MQRASWVVLIVALVVGAFFAGRWSNEARTKHRAETRIDGSPQVATPDDVASRPSAVAALGSGAGTPSAQPVGAAGAMALGAPLPATVAQVPVSANAPGPAPLLAEDGPRLAKVERHWADEGGTGADLLDLARNETQDADARRIEGLIAQTIRQKGGHYSELRLDPPRCTRSVCLMRGVGAGATQNPRSDWQQLSSLVMNETWFREAFDDMRGSVGSDGADTVYLTLFVRCAPGTCRFGGK